MIGEEVNHACSVEQLRTNSAGLVVWLEAPYVVESGSGLLSGEGSRSGGAPLDSRCRHDDIYIASACITRHCSGGKSHMR